MILGQCCILNSTWKLMLCEGAFENVTTRHKNTGLLGAINDPLQEKETNYAVLHTYDITE